MTRRFVVVRRASALAALATCALLASPAFAQADAPLESTAQAGPVVATVRVSPAAPRIGDALTLELEVVAEPEIELLMPEFGEALDRYSIVDFAPTGTVDAEGRTVARQRYTLQPMRSGPQSIPPLLVEFIDRRPGRPPAPDDADAYELLTERVEVDVQSVLAGDDALELRDARGTLQALETPGAPVWPWLLAAVAVLAVASPFAWRLVQAQRALRRRRSAYQIARAELDALLYGARPSGDAIDAFYVELSGIVRRYIEGRFGLHSPEQTTDEFLEELSGSSELLRSQRTLLQRFLSDADLVKFAHHVPDDAGIRASIDLAQRFLEETRDDADARQGVVDDRSRDATAGDAARA